MQPDQQKGLSVLITQEMIAPGAVRPLHLVPAPIALGDIYYSKGINFGTLGIGTTGQVLTVAKGIPSWATPATPIVYQATIIAPSSIVVNDGGVGLTTNAGTELTIISKTITNPSVAGQMLLMANFDMVSPTVANDIFACRIYNPAGSAIYETLRTFEATTDTGTVTMTAVCAVAASGTQTIKMTVQRDTGTGTVTMQNNRNALSWVIFPGASTVA